MRDYLILFTSIISLTAYVSLAKGNRRKIAISVLAGSIGSWGISLLLGDLFHNVLILQIQIWRTAWLLLFVSYLTFVPLCFANRRQRYVGRVFIIGCLISWLCPLLSTFVFFYYFFLFLAFISIFVVGNRIKAFRLINSFFDSASSGFWRVYWVFASLILVLDYAVFAYVIYKGPNVLAAAWPFSHPVIPHWRYGSLILSITACVVLWVRQSL